jgi:hypothetical protein
MTNTAAFQETSQFDSEDADLRADIRRIGDMLTR